MSRNDAPSPTPSRRGAWLLTLFIALLFAIIVGALVWTAVRGVPPI